MKFANIILFATSLLIVSSANAADPKVLIYDQTQMMGNFPSYPVPARQAMSENGPKKVEPNVFEKTVKSAIKTLENSMKGTCTREMKTGISVTAEGNWAVVGVSFTGSMELNILNPELPANCGVAKVATK